MKKSSLLASLILFSVLVYAEVVTQFNGTPIGVTTGIGITNNTSGVFSNNIVAGNNISLTEGASGQLTVAGSWGAYTPAYTILNYRTMVEVTNTTAETAIFTNTIPAGVLGTSKCARIKIRGRYFNNNASATFVLKVYYGSTTLYNDTSSSIGSTTGFAPALIDLNLANIASASSQRLHGSVEISQRTATTGYGDLGQAGLLTLRSLGGTSTENSANALGIGVTVTHSLNGAVSWVTDFVDVIIE